MKIFKNTTTGYAPLIPNLEGYWNHPFDSLPEILQPLVQYTFYTCDWDKLNAEDRRRFAAQHDYQYDPKHEPVTLYQLALLANKLKVQLADAQEERNGTKTTLIRDFLYAINRIINTDRDHVGAELLQLKELSQSRSGPENFSGTGKGTLLKLVYGMAISAYHYDPASNRNVATSTNSDSISADLARIGFSVCPDTVQKYLDEAKDEYGYLIPDDIDF